MDNDARKSAVKLNDRAEMLLRALVEKYIKEGQPVGSRTLSKSIELSLSPATIRNVMADLEDLGLIHAPHTSAGRIPTAQGYRLFVDRLLRVEPMESRFIDEIEQELTSEVDPDKLTATASDLLSRFTRLASVVVMPAQSEATLHQLEYLPLSGERVLVILVTENGRVQNRVIHTDKEYGAAELVEAANYFNERFSHLPLSEVKREIMREIVSDREEMNRLLDVTLNMAKALFEEEADEDKVKISGESHLFDTPGLNSVEQLRDVMDMLKQKQDLLTLLDKSMKADGIQIFFGEESGYEMLGGYSMVARPYHAEGRVIGTLGVIGPARIAYREVIPVVDVTAKLLGQALDRHLL